MSTNRTNYRRPRAMRTDTEEGRDTGIVTVELVL